MEYFVKAEKKEQAKTRKNGEQNEKKMKAMEMDEPQSI